MLDKAIFFNVDQTTAILETTKVTQVLQGDKLQEGATVLVDFGKELFETSVVKLPGKSVKFTTCFTFFSNCFQNLLHNDFIYCIFT